MDADDHRILEMEKRFYRSRAAKAQAVHDELGLSATAYAAALNRLVDDPAAVVEFPQLTARLRRLREARMTQRSPRRSA